MKVNTIDNIHFNAKFRNNEILEKVLRDADEYDLENFLILLKNMERTNDGHEYYLKADPQPMLGADYLFLYKNGHILGRRAISIWHGRVKEHCGNILSKVTSKLSAYYPAHPRESRPRRELLNEIHDKLDAKV